MDNVVCEICGSSDSRCLVKCVQCNTYEHCYCMQVLPFEFPRDWYCDECQKKANGSPKPTGGGQNSPQTPKKFGSAKVKFISCEEVALLSRERLPCSRPNSAVPRNYVRPASPPHVKQSSRLKSISPSRSNMQVHALKQFAAANHNQAKIEHVIRPASPPSVKQSSNMKCISPSRSDMQVHALKQSAAENSDQAKIVDENVKWKTLPGRTMPIVHRRRTVGVVKAKADSQTEDKTREQKIVNADKEKINSRIKDGPREKGAFCSPAIVNANGCKSEMKSLNNNLDTVMVINSSAEYSRRPPPASCWTGCFLIKESGPKSNLGEFKAYFPSKVSAKVYDIAKRMPINLQLEVLPRINDWPKSFETIRPVHEDIGLFFFASEVDWHEKKHPHFLEADFVMRAYINGIKLLIYSSNVLPPDSQWIDGESYLWGIFVRSKGKSNPQRFGSAST